MIREEEFHSNEGQRAWSFYKSWMKLYHRSTPNNKAFIKSKFFNAFIRFAVYSQKVHLVDIGAFIWLMKEKELPPSMWTNDIVYIKYLDFLDRKIKPTKLIAISIDTLFDEAKRLHVSVKNIFTVITTNELILLLRRRQLSPWILLNSGKFKQFYITKTSTEEKTIINSIIKFKYWNERFRDNPKTIKNIRAYIKELNL